jgi:hypothetical protein
LDIQKTLYLNFWALLMMGETTNEIKRKFETCSRTTKETLGWDSQEKQR